MAVPFRRLSLTLLSQPARESKGLLVLLDVDGWQGAVELIDAYTELIDGEFGEGKVDGEDAFEVCIMPAIFRALNMLLMWITSRCL